MDTGTADGDTIDPDRSLAEAGVYDGELLMIHEVGASESSVLVDDVEARPHRTTAARCGSASAVG